MKKEIAALNHVRAIAVFVILLCHYFLFSDLNNGVGRYLAGTGNMLFFLVSALLYGLKYPVGGQAMDYKHFAARRVAKIGASVWPFLIIIVALYLVFGVKFSWIDVGLNFAFLGYLGELPGNEHLWFLTVLAACYAEIMLLKKLKAGKPTVPWVLLGVSTLLVIVGERLGIPSGAFLTLGLYAFVFLKSDWLLQKSKTMKLWMVIAILLLNIVCFVLEFNGLFVHSRSLHFIFTGLCGLSLLSLLLRYLPDKSNKVSSFLCGISFEVYLVHHTLCAGPFFSVTRWPFTHVGNFCLLVAISIALAFMLKEIGKAVRLVRDSD